MTFRQSIHTGTLIAGRFQLDRVLHTGRGATRYLVFDIEEGMRPLALHEWDVRFPSPAARKEAIVWLDQRLKQLQSYAHPGICTMRSLYVPPEPDTALFLLTDHLPGLTLAEELEEGDGTLSWRQVVDWGISLCETLAHLHAQPQPYLLGSLHAEAVVLAVGAGEPVIVDPGIYRWLDTTSVHPGFVPFEQYIGREDRRSDLYALGALMYALLGGRDPDAEYARLRRTGKDVQGTQRALFPPLDARAHGIPPALSAVVARATAFGIDDRYADAAALRTALVAVRGPAATVETALPPEPSDDPVWQRLGLTHQQWFALPLAERNRRLLGIIGQVKTQGAE